MTVWDTLTWVTVAILGPGVLVICVAVARDLRRLLGGPPPRDPGRGERAMEPPRARPSSPDIRAAADDLH